MAEKTKMDMDQPPAKRKKQSYGFEDVHKDLENQKYAGSYGWDNAAYMAIAETKAGVDMKKFHSRKRMDLHPKSPRIGKDEYFMPSLLTLLDNPATKENWDRIVTFDPYGLTATTPTIAATTSKLNIPELADLERDGVIVDEHGAVNTMKICVYYAWNLPELSHRLNMNEQTLRDTLYKFSRDERLKDPSVKVFLPQVGGMTIYTFGDVTKIPDPNSQIAVRVHDECNGSDVFGTDICTCRPYLMYAMRKAITKAQEGGVGIIIYFRKEGRSLGEVTKFRVYNARKHQEGGDRAEKYFFHTENIAGIRDARFQGMMPDALNWLGIKNIDFLYSMSNEKYDALVEAGIKIQQRVPLPDAFVPRGAFVELHAKIASGYHSEEIKSADVVNNMRSLKTIRTQCMRVYQLAKANQLRHFEYHPENMHVAVDAVVKCIKNEYPELKIPLHSRFRHFNEHQMQSLRDMWTNYRIDDVEQIRRLIDLATVSVLLDAGAGKTWSYVAADKTKVGRSEGLAIASFDMFCGGAFSSDSAVRTRANSIGLKNLRVEDVKAGFQVTSLNPLVGLEGRTALLQRLGTALEAHPEFFGAEVSRPGNVVDYLLANAKDGHVSIEVLWTAIIQGFESIWPQNQSGINRGDAWCYQPLKKAGQVGSDIVPFHKLSQWLMLSWLEPLMKLDKFPGLNIIIDDIDTHTCLAEYRNGGLLIDAGVLDLKDKSNYDRSWDVGSELIVEWRAMTIPLIDLVAEAVRVQLGLTKEQLSLAKVLEGGTWRAGRIIAEEKRGKDKPPPIKIRSDGTVF